MALYAIGDVQGCYDELGSLLERIAFRPGADRLWFVGDLVNRGPRSLEVLRLVRDLGDDAVTVLGNHDLHLLAAAHGARKPGPLDTFAAVLDAPDRDELIEWLRHRPLLHRDPDTGFVMIHAGLPPQWDIPQAARCASEVEGVLRSEGYPLFLRAMYGNTPDRWSDRLKGMDRLRFTLNSLTRLRLCDRDGRLHLKEKGAPFGRDDGLLPWFAVPGRASAGATIVCGHWSVLGRFEAPGVYALDSGCVWGGALTALRLDEGAREWFDVPCRQWCAPGKE